jgi:hypothetical protein
MEIGTRLNRLRDRRTGKTKSDGTATASLRTDFSQSPFELNESYERNNETPSVKYALGSMQAVDKRFTEKCYEEGDRVKNQLISSIASPAIAFEYQGVAAD